MVAPALTWLAISRRAIRFNVSTGAMRRADVVCALSSKCGGSASNGSAICGARDDANGRAGLPVATLDHDIHTRTIPNGRAQQQRRFAGSR